LEIKPIEANAVQSLVPQSNNRLADTSDGGQKQTSAHVRVMSALPPKADIGTQSWNVRFVPKADMRPPHHYGRRIVLETAYSSIAIAAIAITYPSKRLRGPSGSR